MTAPRPLAVQLDAFRTPRKPRTMVPFAPGSATSRAGAENARATLQRNERIVLDYITACGPTGATRREIAVACFEREQNRVTGRVDTLLRKNAIAKLWLSATEVATRDGGEVLVAVGQGRGA